MGFFLFVFGVIVLPNLLWWWWTDRRLRNQPRLRLAFSGIMAAFVGFILWLLVEPDTARRAHHFLPMWWMALVYIWHLLVMPVLIVTVPFLALAGRRLRPDGADPSRRRLLRAATAFAPPLAAGVGMAVALPELQDFRVRRLDVPVAGLPPALDGRTIAHVTDLHCGKYTTAAQIDGIVDTVNGLEADLVLLTGDLIDISLADLPVAIDFLRRFDRRSGLFLCEGNHDRIQNGEAFARDVKAAGLRLLLDEAETVTVAGQPVRVCGATWQRGANARDASLARLRRKLEPGAFPILLAHHPHVFDHADDFPLMLAGHTHGGQLMLNERLGAGPVLFRYWSGTYRANDRTLVVSNGVGNWFPLRAHAPAEILHLTLRRA